MNIPGKIAVLAAAVALTGSPILAGRPSPISEHRVIVCTALPPDQALMQAGYLTANIFAPIGITLDWRTPSHCPVGALRITIAKQVPPELKSSVLAYSLPMEGVNIVVFLDRVQATVVPSKVAVLLAHVYAHEITHMLQGVRRHSDNGLMKAYWDGRDYCEMAWRSLPFTTEDVDLIYLGLARREARVFPEPALMLGALK
jgi:hypothetical protein